MSCIPAIPETTVQKITGVIIIEINRMKTSPNGFIEAAVAGANRPSTMATTTAMATCTQSTA
jgi:hypothetical protein